MPQVTAPQVAESQVTASQVSPSVLQPAAQKVVQPVVAAPVAAPAVTASPVATQVAKPAPTPAPVAAAPQTVAKVSRDDLMTLLLKVVSDKTGYPSDMLNMEMELEADLGIDSIKRVEILSAMQDAVPELPEVDTSVMAGLVTLGQIVEYMNGRIASSTPVVGQTAIDATEAVAIAPAAQEFEAVAGISRDALMVLLLKVVSDKTGYPADMLNMEMELEADLGIDSIKRVEILSAMQDAVPELPEVNTTVMAKLVTLGQIVEYMNGQLEGDSANSSAASPASDHNVNAVTESELLRYTLEAVPAAPTKTRLPGLSDGPIAVTDDGNGVAAALVALLNQAGIEAEAVSEVPETGFAGAIFLGGLRDFANVDEAIAVNYQAFAAARTIANSVVSGGVFVTVNDYGGDFGCIDADDVQAWSFGLTGLARTAAIEWPTTNVKAIDVQTAGLDTDEIANAIADELLAGGPELEVALRADGSRLVLRNKPVEVETGSMPLGEQDVIVVSGGGRGVTAATMIELARASGASFALLGRSELVDEPEAALGATDDATLKRALLDAAVAAGESLSPAELGRQVSQILANREILGTVSEIERAGGRAIYLSVDITDRDAVNKALAEVRSSLGAITGIVHGAGVLADKLIADKTDEQFNRVFDTKVQGLRALLGATVDDSLKLLCFFSSVAARTGNTGQADYAMANEILNKVAVAESERRGSEVVVKSLGWGPWAGGMVSPALKSHFEAMGVALIPIDEGARMLVRRNRQSAAQPNRTGSRRRSLAREQRRSSHREGSTADARTCRQPERMRDRLPADRNRRPGAGCAGRFVARGTLECGRCRQGSCLVGAGRTVGESARRTFCAMVPSRAMIVLGRTAAAMSADSMTFSIPKASRFPPIRSADLIRFSMDISHGPPSAARRRLRQR